MGSEWRIATLDEVYEFRSGLSKSRSAFGSGYSFLSFKDVFYNFFVPDNLTELVESTAKERENCSVRRGDVFLTRTSETFDELGMSCVALRDYEGATFNGFTKRLRPKNPDSIVPQYAGYYFRTRRFRRLVTSISSMSTRASLNNEILGKLKIIIPPISDQKRIGFVLKSLDDKIELNRRMNETLEQMAQALFQSWFVDFDPVIDKALAAGNPIPEPLQARADRRAALGDRRKPLPEEIARLFPDAFVETDDPIGLGWVPEGWGVKAVEDIVEINPRISLPKGQIAPYVDMKALPTAGYSIDASILKEYSGGAKFQNGDVLLARITPCLENGKTGVVDFLKDDAIGFGSTEFIVLRGNGHIKTAFVACLSRNESFRNHCIQSMVGSSGRQRVQNAAFSNFYMAIPSSQILLGEFHKLVASLFKDITRNSNEATTLSSLRDTLLPKLISGELRIPL